MGRDIQSVTEVAVLNRIAATAATDCTTKLVLISAASLIDYILV